MTEVTIRIRDDGPLVIQGDVQLVDAEGAPLVWSSDKPALALCRCGQSGNKPFCDGAHKNCGFSSCIRAT